MGSDNTQAGASLSQLLTSVVVIVVCVVVSMIIAFSAYELILDSEFEIPQ